MPVPVANLIQSTAASYGVDPSLALAVATVESGLDQNARGSAGEIGVMQLMPATAAALGVDPTNLQQNIAGGVMLLAQLLQQFGDPQEAVAAYNAGPNAVMTAIVRGGDNWLAYVPASTRSYVAKIFGNVSAPPPPDQSPVVDASTNLVDVSALPDPSVMPPDVISVGVNWNAVLPWALAGVVGFFILRDLVEV